MTKPTHTSPIFRGESSFPLSLSLLPLLALFLSLPITAGQAQNADTNRRATVTQVEQLDHAISDTIAHPEYRWRLPREHGQNAPVSQNSFWLMVSDFFRKVFEKIGQWLRALADWLDHLLRRKEKDDEPLRYTNWQSSIQLLLFALTAVTASILAIFLLRMWKQRKTLPTLTATAIQPAPDIADENVTADQLPSDEWMAMARDLLSRGELRLALRAMFLAGLVNLAAQEKLVVAKHKSNRDYIAELERRAHDQPGLLTAFSTNVRLLEEVWYGLHTATQDTVVGFSANLDVINHDMKRVATHPSPSQA